MKMFFGFILAVVMLASSVAGAQTAEVLRGKTKDPNCIYFAHPLSTYNTELEKYLVERIKQAFPGKWVLNPNNPEVDAGVKRYVKSYGNPMLYFVVEVLPYCTGGTVGLPLRDGTWTTGAYLELFEAFKMEYPFYSIDPEGHLTRLEHLPAGALTIRESRQQMHNPDGTYKPY